jgi:hypothetical protein
MGIETCRSYPLAGARICGGEHREGNFEFRELHRLLALTFAPQGLEPSGLELTITR